MSQQIALLTIQIGLILFLAKFFGMLAARCKIPPVMGELVAGIICGPYCLGSIPLPGFPDGIFPLVTLNPGISVDPKLYSIATLGSIVLLFIAGLETDVRTFFKYSVAGTIVGLGGIICSFLCGVAVGTCVLHWSFMDPRSLFLGILCTATSVGISARILSERHAMDSPEGVTIMAAAVIDDVLGIVCLAIVTGIASVELRGGEMNWSSIIWIAIRSFGIWLGLTAIGLICARKIAAFLRIFRTSRIFSVMAFGLALLLAGAFEKAGLAMIVGAFVMGLTLSKTDTAFRIRASLTPVYSLLVPLFFVVMGMLVDIRVLKSPSVLLVGLALTAMAIIGKVVGCALPALGMNFNWLGALRVGVGMIPRCEVVLIIAGIAATTMMKNPAIAGATPEMLENMPLEVPIFDSRLFGIAIIMPLFTALLAPPLLNLTLNIKGKGVKHEVPDIAAQTTEFTFSSEAAAMIVLHELVSQLHHDGYYYTPLSKGVEIIQFRRDATFFSLQISGNTFIFSSLPQDIPFIKTAIYESVVEIHRNLSELKNLASPDVLKPDIFQKPEHANIRHNDLQAILADDCIIPDLQATDRDQAFAELLRLLQQHKLLKNYDLCLKDAIAREDIASTYQGDGIALPHARTDGTAKLVAALGISRQGVIFPQPDGSAAKAHLIILSICPREENEPYLQFISRLAAVLAQPNITQKILAANTVQDIAKIVRG